MQQFDVCRLKAPHNGLVVILQHDLLDELATRVVAPLSEDHGDTLISKLRFEVTIDGASHVVHLDRLAAIHRAAIDRPFSNLGSEQHRIKNALDLLFLGL